jgi:hypothetical protein
MGYIGVITGDIINSTEILKSGHRDELLDVLKNTVNEINSVYQSDNIKMEIYRGDSFQIIVKNFTETLKIALIIRTALIANSKDNIRWDARIGIGIGTGEYITTSIAESDGDAFHKSGQAFDSLDKNSRITIQTPDSDFNNELSVSTGFADDIISNWTKTQAKIIYLFLIKSLIQKDLAEITGKSPQVISKLFSASKLSLILNYEKRYRYKINNDTSK